MGGIQQLRGQNFAIFFPPFPPAWTVFIPWAWTKTDIIWPPLPSSCPRSFWMAPYVKVRTFLSMFQFEKLFLIDLRNTDLILYFSNILTFFLQNVPDLNAKIRQARQEILRFFNTNEENHCVIFTSGTTQALKIVAENFNYNGSGRLLICLSIIHFL